MVEPRTVKTLLALLISMTSGALLLWMMSGDPLPPGEIAAVVVAPQPPVLDAKLLDTDAPMLPSRWRHIVIHSSPSVESDIARRCHFVVVESSNGTAVHASALWKRQAAGLGVAGQPASFNAETISVCLIGDFSKVAPGPEQYKALVALTQLLQGAPLNINHSHVYLRCELDGSDAPGLAFPVESFTKQLIP
ncbi:MAG: peptidoglycan recognition family protein [Planctomycetaceae bacterium]|nr:peptidoglycan recognition protein family protein [Planctomycetaceae bacterium]